LERPESSQGRGQGGRTVDGWPQKPSTNPPPNSVKFFAATELLEQVHDRAWLVKMTNALNQHRQRKNLRKKSHLMNGAQEHSAAEPQPKMTV
jgi:hypothetical protein